MTQWEFRSLADLGRDVRAWLDDLPGDIEVVAGVPRSGMLIASMISLHRHIPMTDVDGLIAGRLLDGGHRFDIGDPSLFLAERRRVLVVDDSLLSGRQLQVVRQQLASSSLPHEVTFGCVYVMPGKEALVDSFREPLPYPRLFEWNLMHHPILKEACVDIDGVLCRDPTRAENDDGASYTVFLETVEPRAAPTFPIGTLVTCRLEKYRAATEDWLARHGIVYDNLVMMPYASKAERLAAGQHAEFKSEAYRSSRASIFIESSFPQARGIVDITARPVICTDRMVLLTATVQTKSDIVDGLRKAGSMSGRVRWLRRNRRSILWWARRRRARLRERAASPDPSEDRTTAAG